ncbi:MAG: helix-turn-helix domain-containing protein, partial [Rhodobacteraceae bacterium]|nr:helix-turn-helix domain-containing protein [Paracoccaceae bacterium]
MFMGTVSKALELLDLFTRARPVIGLSDLARLADLNKATCYRLASALCAYGLIEQIDATKEYRLGPATLRLAALREAHVPTRDAAMPVLQTLADATGETAHLSLLIGHKLKAIALAYSNAHATRVMMED